MKTCRATGRVPEVDPRLAPIDLALLAGTVSKRRCPSAASSRSGAKTLHGLVAAAKSPLTPQLLV